MTTSRVPQFTVPAWLAPHVNEVRTWPVVQGPNPRCRVGVCDRTAHSLGLCLRHYDLFRVRAHRVGQALAEWLPEHEGEVLAARAVAAPERTCWVAACGRTAHANGLCKAHHRLAKHHFREQPDVGSASDSETAS